MNKASDTKMGSHWPVDFGAASMLIVVSALIYLVAFQPLLRQRAHAQTAEAELAIHQREALDLAATHQRFQQKLAALAGALPDSPVELRTSNYLNRRLDELIQLTKDSGLAIDEVRQGETFADEHYRKILIYLTGTGTFQTSTRFLDRIHASFRDMAVRSFDLKAIPEGDPPTATCKLMLIWYTKREKI